MVTQKTKRSLIIAGGIGSLILFFSNRGGAKEGEGSGAFGGTDEPLTIGGSGEPEQPFDELISSDLPFSEQLESPLVSSEKSSGTSGPNQSFPINETTFLQDIGGKTNLALGTVAFIPSFISTKSEKFFEKAFGKSPAKSLVEVSEKRAVGVITDVSESAGQIALKSSVKKSTKLGAKSLLKTSTKGAAKVGVKAIPFIGLPAGILFDVRTGIPVPEAIARNFVGDVVGAAGAVGGSFAGPVGTFGGAVGGQIIGEVGTSKVFDIFTPTQQLEQASGLDLTTQDQSSISQEQIKSKEVVQSSFQGEASFPSEDDGIDIEPLQSRARDSNLKASQDRLERSNITSRLTKTRSARTRRATRAAQSRQDENRARSLIRRSSRGGGRSRNVGDPFIRSSSGRAIGSRQPVGTSRSGGFLF